jgi:hypothetical protein
MRTFILSLLGVLLLTPLSPAQYRIEIRRAYPPAYVTSVPAQPEQLVTSWYRRYLNREPDPGGLATWTNALRSGNSSEMTLASILSSDEYFSKGGGTPEGFIRTLFADVAGRQPTAVELDMWLARMSYQQRLDIAYALLTGQPQATGVPPVLQYEPARPAWPYGYRRPMWRFWR